MSRYVVLGRGVENNKNIAMATNINTNGNITNIHDNTDAPFSHNLFNNHVQKKTYINWIVKTNIVLLTLQLYDPAQNIWLLPMFWNMSTIMDIIEMTKYT